MSFDLAHAGVNAIVWIMLAVGVVSRLLRISAVRGSHQRHVYGSLHILAYGLIAVFRLADAVLYSIEGEFSRASMNLVTVPIWVLLIVLGWDDDNWFNGQLKRLKKGIKKLRSWRPRVPQVVVPSPSPT